MNQADGMTPRQRAYSIAIDWLRNAYRGNTGDLDELTPAVKRDTLEQIAKLHAELLDRSDLYGNYLDR